jgi:hypothetical protein
VGRKSMFGGTGSLPVTANSTAGLTNATHPNEARY